MSNELANSLNQLMNFGDGFFEDFGEPFFNSDSNKQMSSDVVETKNGYQVTVDVPGVNKEDIDLSYDQDVLSIQAKRNSSLDRKDEKGNVLASERSYGKYVRNYHLPDVNADKISAKVEAGVLTINMPKTEMKETGHKINIG
ncbi:small heat shock protein [Ligilactobacillus salitolerans]|uniref:Small heat shock protein n=1 Tax=Ligilactobacillus salitolerans TaxID=1808352 RepID=A0A401IVP1_9LACO|nr:Hsp20/alpha crystallin family protein [Ligilactobacillus salitolerans]GBG95557.1 small heat shock protein [Ligilactobacillus salitolerans]